MKKININKRLELVGDRQYEFAVFLLIEVYIYFSILIALCYKIIMNNLIYNRRPYIEGRTNRRQRVPSSLAIERGLKRLLS